MTSEVGCAVRTDSEARESARTAHFDALNAIREEARRLARAVGDLMHRVIVADPYGDHPDTDAALNRLAQGVADAHAIVRQLTDQLEHHHD